MKRSDFFKALGVAVAAPSVITQAAGEIPPATTPFKYTSPVFKSRPQVFFTDVMKALGRYKPTTKPYFSTPDFQNCVQIFREERYNIDSIDDPKIDDTFLLMKREVDRMLLTGKGSATRFGETDLPILSTSGMDELLGKHGGRHMVISDTKSFRGIFNPIIHQIFWVVGPKEYLFVMANEMYDHVLNTIKALAPSGVVESNLSPQFSKLVYGNITFHMVGIEEPRGIGYLLPLGKTIVDGEPVDRFSVRYVSNPITKTMVGDEIWAHWFTGSVSLETKIDQVNTHYLTAQGLELHDVKYFMSVAFKTLVQRSVRRGDLVLNDETGKVYFVDRENGKFIVARPVDGTGQTIQFPPDGLPKGFHVGYRTCAER